MKKSHNYTTNHIIKEQNTKVSFPMSYFKTFPVLFSIAQDQLHRKCRNKNTDSPL